MLSEHRRLHLCTIRLMFLIHAAVERLTAQAILEKVKASAIAQWSEDDWILE
jgi:hypothetical protein